MPRKKKKEEPEIYHTPFGSTTIRIPPYPEIDLSPYTIETTSLSDDTRRFITTTHSGTSITYTGSATGEAQTIYYPPQHWEPYSSTIGYEDLMRQLGKEEEAKVNIVSKKSANKNERIVFCKDFSDLSVERILITLSAVKGKLMLDTAPIHIIKEIQCKMTPMVKKHIIEASKKLKMYGKKSPIIPSFDEYGNRLPDQIEIGDNKGITVKIVEPEEYGDAYFELKAIEFPSIDYMSQYEWGYNTDDLPF